MKLNTMAAVMTSVTRIENDSLLFYQENADKFPELKDIFLSWVKENKRFEKQVKQTYFGVITDTLESNFAFEGLDTDDHDFELTLSEDAGLSDTLQKANEMEDAIKGFYLKAAQTSEGLMADIPRLFRRIAKKREDRSRSLESLGV